VELEFYEVRRYLGALSYFVPWRTYTPLRQEYAAFVSSLSCSISQSIVIFLSRVHHIHPCNFGHNTQKMSRIGLRELPSQELTHRIPTAINLIWAHVLQGIAAEGLLGLEDRLT
jgi:hypothetical protein